MGDQGTQGDGFKAMDPAKGEEGFRAMGDARDDEPEVEGHFRAMEPDLMARDGENIAIDTTKGDAA